MNDDYLNPNWNNISRVHDWKNYISDELRNMWESFTAPQKIAIGRNAQERADAEEWD